MQGIVWPSSSTSHPSRSRGGWTSLIHLSVVGNSRTPWTTSPHVGTTSVSPHALLAVDISPPSLSIAEPRGLVNEIGIPPFPHRTNLPDLAFFFLQQPQATFTTSQWVSQATATLLALRPPLVVENSLSIMPSVELLIAIGQWLAREAGKLAIWR